MVDETPVRLYYGSPTQINAVLPQDLAPGRHTLTVKRYADVSYGQLAAQGPALDLTVAKVALALVERTEGSNVLPAAQFPDGSFAGEALPWRSGDYVILYLTGLGRKAQTFPEGVAPKAAVTALEPVEILVEGTPAEVLYAGVQPDYPGFDQIVLRLPLYVLAPGKRTAALVLHSPASGQTLRYEVNSY